MLKDVVRFLSLITHRVTFVLGIDFGLLGLSLAVIILVLDRSSIVITPGGSFHFIKLLSQAI